MGVWPLALQAQLPVVLFPCCFLLCCFPRSLSPCCHHPAKRAPKLVASPLVRVEGTVYLVSRSPSSSCHGLVSARGAGFFNALLAGDASSAGLQLRPVRVLYSSASGRPRTLVQPLFVGGASESEHEMGVSSWPFASFGICAGTRFVRRHGSWPRRHFVLAGLVRELEGAGLDVSGCARRSPLGCGLPARSLPVATRVSLARDSPSVRPSRFSGSVVLRSRLAGVRVSGAGPESGSAVFRGPVFAAPFAVSRSCFGGPVSRRGRPGWWWEAQSCAWLAHPELHPAGTSAH